MKTFTRKTALLFALVFCCAIALAQPKTGSVILAVFEPQNNVIQNASVIAVNGNRFTCSFSQTGSEYVLETSEDGVAKVVSTKGGKYKVGTEVLFAEYYINDDNYDCFTSGSFTETVIVKFADGKSFIGFISRHMSPEDTYAVSFYHSGNSYTFNKDGLILSKTGGVYAAGTKAKVFCASVVQTPPALKLKLKEQKLNKQ